MKRAILFFTVIACFAGCSSSKVEVTGSFKGADIKRVVLRAHKAEEAGYVNLPEGSPAVQFIGHRYTRKDGISKRMAELIFPERELPRFVTRQFGDTLLLTTQNEREYQNQEMYLDIIHLWISLPHNIELLREKRALTTDGTADLSPPQLQVK